MIDAGGRTDPDIFAVGAARRGVDWEVAAIPDLRVQAAELTAHLVANRTQQDPGPAKPAGEGAASA